MLPRSIRYFLAVAEHRSFTRAAAALHVSQPALSQQIRQLEELLDAQLFDRTGRATRLTDAGQAFELYAKRALRELNGGRRAIHDVRDHSRGSLRVAITPTFTAYLVGPLFARFNDLYPNITLTILEMTQERIEERLADDAIDIGIAFEPVRSTDIVSRKLLEETLVLVVGENHPHAGQSRLAIQALTAEAMVLLTPEFATREQIDRSCRKHKVHPRVVAEANSISTVIEVVRHSRLSTLLPANIAQSRSQLSVIHLDPPLEHRVAVLLLRRDAYQSAAAKAFVTLSLDFPAIRLPPRRAKRLKADHRR
jgi:LysR family cyn operon transcriptional activator